MPPGLHRQDAGTRDRAAEVRPRPRTASTPDALPPEPAKGRTRPAIVDAQIVEAAVVCLQGQGGCLVGGGDLPPGTARPRAGARAESLDGTDEQPILRRKKKKSRGPLVLIGMVVVGVLVAGSIVGYLVRMQVVAEEKLAKQADEEYGKGEHAVAQKTFEKLLAEYPDSEEIAALPLLRRPADASRCPRGDDPREPGCGHRALKQFLTAQKESEFSKPKSGFGSDILEAGRKLAIAAGHADDRVKAFRADRGGKPGELDRAEKALATGRELSP